MSIDLILPVSMLMGIICWSLVFKWYLDPLLAPLPIREKMKPLLLFNSLRYIGLMFLIPGVTTEPLDSRFADPAAYGDLIAALMALAALIALHYNQKAGIASIWLFNIWGLADLLNAVARGLLYTPDGSLGAAYWIPATIVPLLLVMHVYIFRYLLELLPKNRAASAQVAE